MQKRDDGDVERRRVDAEKTRGGEHGVFVLLAGSPGRIPVDDVVPFVQDHLTTVKPVLLKQFSGVLHNILHLFQLRGIAVEGEEIRLDSRRFAGVEHTAIVFLVES